ncbi:MAG: AAA family ATPase [Pseudomonadota bacterium]
MNNSNRNGFHIDIDLKKLMENGSIQFWTYAPGEKARLWNEFYEKGIMCIGGDKLGDLSDYNTKEEIQKKYQTIYRPTTQPKVKAQVYYDFVNKMKVGDVVFVKDGIKKMVGVGFVESEYFFDNERTEYKNCRKARWIKNGLWETKDYNFPLKTLSDITRFTSDVDRLISLVEKTNHSGPEDNKQNKIAQSNIIKHPSNQILYGPPGTGKTYQTVNHALSIIEKMDLTDLNSSMSKKNRKELTEKFKQYKKKGQIEFITFHQNYAYEDFIQGLRPDVNSAGNGLSFEKKDGVFKKIADRALEEYKSVKEKSKNYVLIIDEINRANISRVFGELITLIEEDKRYGQVNEMEATLPSGDPFCIPPNLYIIGTMNTADKSIALLDIALRRRFEFIKVYPVTELVDKQFRNLFEKLNRQIRKEKGPDFQIGHAYLMSKNGDIPDIKEVMNNKIIPLLYEYFMNDGNAVKDILTESGIEVEENCGLCECRSYKNG